ncbi:histidine kinase [Kineococcus gypseus]|uniref:histidine kinase n=1 Tax=Kineococcus gypseus TaxID=1637102 RepID=UPI003D7C6AA9
MEGTAAGRPRAALAVATAAWLPALLAVVAVAAARPPLGPEALYLLVDVTVALVHGTVGGVVLARRRHPVPWLLALTAVGGGLAALGGAAGVLAGRGGPAAALEPLVVLNAVAWVPGTLALFTVVPWLVREDRPGAAWAGAAAGAAVAVGATAAQVAGTGDPRPWAVPAVLVGAAATADAVRRWRTGAPAGRIGLGWLALGTALMTASFAPFAVPALMGVLPAWSTPALHLAVQAVFPAAVLAVVLRQRLWGIDLAVSRAVTAGVLTAVLFALYLVVTAAVTAVLPASGVAQVVAAAAVAVAVQPSRLWVQRRVARLVHGDALDPGRAAQRLGAQLGRAATGGELLQGLVDRVGTGLRLESVVLLDDDGRLRAARGTATGPGTAVPLTHRGQRLGELVVTAPPGEALDARAGRALEELSGVVAAGLALVRASEDLERARDRVTSARLAERRLLRREVHDGLGPALAGLSMGLQGARNLVGTDPAAAVDLLDALSQEVRGRVDDVRQLSRALLPPALEDLGLGPALEELAARHRAGGLEVRVRCADACGLPVELVAAAYGVVAEALTNAARHAGATRVDVDVAVRGAELVVEVVDDGAGVPAGAVEGVGSRSMRERAEEQGGAWQRVPADGGGTAVRARMPLRAGTGTRAGAGVEGVASR